MPRSIAEPAFRRPVFYWLLTGCLLIFLMVIVGGITRLTGSGLSITEWKLIHGTLPPMSPQAWQEEFDNYKQIPQFRHLNYHFTITEFKRIYWWEYIHRLLGRIIGMVFLIPFAWFYVKRMLDPPLVRKLLVLFALGGLQGFLGWYMVSSGLSENIYVSHFRLAIHLVTAFVTFGYALWLALGMWAPDPVPQPAASGLRTFGYGFFSLVLLQLVYGAFVAGLKAGYVYNTFPMMDDAWVPGAVGTAWSNLGAEALVSDLATVQFIHRCIAWLLLGASIWFFTRIRTSIRAGVLTWIQHRAANGLVATVALQFTLGVLTIIYKVPVVLGVAHQAGAFLLFGFTVMFVHSLDRCRIR